MFNYTYIHKHTKLGSWNVLLHVIFIFVHVNPVNHITSFRTLLSTNFLIFLCTYSITAKNGWYWWWFIRINFDTKIICYAPPPNLIIFSSRKTKLDVYAVSATCAVSRSNLVIKVINTQKILILRLIVCKEPVNRRPILILLCHGVHGGTILILAQNTNVDRPKSLLNCWKYCLCLMPPMALVKISIAAV